MTFFVIYNVDDATYLIKMH